MEVCPSLHPPHCRHHPGVRLSQVALVGRGGGERCQAVAVGRKDLPVVLGLSRWPYTELY